MRAKVSNNSSGKSQAGGPWPDPRGKTGIMNASDPELRAGIAKYEGLSDWSARLLIFALFIEVVLAAFPPENRAIERWAGVVAAALVALAVWGEVAFAKKASLRQGELLRRSDNELKEANDRLGDLDLEAGYANEKAAIAAERAAKAEQETEKIKLLTAWR